ncbi:MAG TPA: methyltransferase domain-containing protein, partial [Terriglobales bacterium]|nr:methyltransferase domain-containing protein [Terriglobales bacterium]
RKIKGGLKQLYFFFHQAYFSAKATKVECKICGFKADRLKSDNWHPYSICPRCESTVRQRLLWATLQHHTQLNLDTIITRKSVLHFAPEKVLRSRLKSASAVYETADYFTEGYDYPDIDHCIDISSMGGVKNETYDCVIACDVLEHVPDHKKALREIHRILKSPGYCILTVPQKDNLKVTYEDPSITDPKERKLKFGQSDHVRIYGEDFPQMIKEAGFEVAVVDENYFKKETGDKNVLFPPVLSTHPLATNYRKIFFGKKS